MIIKFLSILTCAVFHPNQKQSGAKVHLYWQAGLKEMQGAAGVEKVSLTFLHNTDCSPRQDEATRKPQHKKDKQDCMANDNRKV